MDNTQKEGLHLNSHTKMPGFFLCYLQQILEMQNLYAVFYVENVLVFTSNQTD